MAAFYKKEEVEKAEEVEQALEEMQEAKDAADPEGAIVTTADQTAETKAELKTALVKHITGLMAERTALIDRFNVVLAESKAKSGDTQEYDNYINAVSGISVDVTDASATWNWMSV